MYTTVFAIVCLLALGTASGQGPPLTCSGLDVDRDDAPFSGVELSVCSVATDQCCTQSFLDRIQREVRRDLLDGLRAQLRVGTNSLQDVLNRIADYLEGDFISGIRDALPLSTLLRDNINEITSALDSILSRANFAISNANPEFNTTQVFVDMIGRIEGVLARSSFLNSEQASCIRDRIERGINRTSLLALGRSLEAIRRSFSAFTRIINFLRNFNGTLDGFNAASFPTQCVERVLEVSFCGRCRARIPPLCSRTCGALVRGCFAGFYSGLEGEFNNLWNVVEQIIRTADANIREIFVNEGTFFEVNVFSLLSECSITLPNFRKRRQIPNFLPEGILEQASRLSGVFQYAESGPEFCSVDDDEVDFCRGSDSEDDRNCDSDEVCTSTCQCWDGEGMRDTDTPRFTGVGIEDQGGNPVIQIPEDVNADIAFARSTVVTSFLTSGEFDEVTPEGLTIPPPASYGSGGITLAVSMATVLITILFTLVSM